MGFNDINLQVSGPQQPASIYKTKVLKGQVPFAIQVTEPNTKYVIKHNFVLDGDVTIPENCILEFDGGSISGGHTITGQNTGINAGLVRIFGIDVNIVGNWSILEVYPEWWGAKGDRLNDDTSYIQKAINVSAVLHCRVMFAREFYKITSITIKNQTEGLYSYCGSYIEGLASNEDALIRIQNGPVISRCASLTIYNLCISSDVANTNQKLIYLHARKSDTNGGGGAWHWNIQNVLMSPQAGQIGVYTEADDTVEEVDVANQYIHFKNVNIYKNNQNANSRCLVFKGQIGQVTHVDCEYNGNGTKLPDGDNVADWVIEYIPIASNDNAFMPQTFINCTFQTTNNAIWGNYAHLIFIGCHFEDVAYASVKTNNYVLFNGNNISGGSVPFRLVNGGRVEGENNTWNAPNGAFYSCEGNAAVSRSFGLKIIDIGNYTNCNGYVTQAGTIFLGCNKNVHIKESIGDVIALNSELQFGETITITADTTFRIITKKSNSGSNIISLSEDIIQVYTGDVLVFTKISGGYSLICYKTKQAYSYQNYGLNIYNGDNIILDSPISGDILTIGGSSSSKIITLTNKTGNTINISTKHNSPSSNIIYRGVKYYYLANDDTIILFHLAGSYYIVDTDTFAKVLATDVSQFSSALVKGTMFFDTVNNKPVWWNGSAWVDATGATV